MIADRSHHAREKTISLASRVWSTYRKWNKSMNSQVSKRIVTCLQHSRLLRSLFAHRHLSGTFFLSGGLFFSSQQRKRFECTHSLCVYCRLSPRLWRSVCHTCRRRFSNTTYARCIYAWIIKCCVRMRDRAISSPISHARLFRSELADFLMIWFSFRCNESNPIKKIKHKCPCSLLIEILYTYRKGSWFV